MKSKIKVPKAKTTKPLTLKWSGCSDIGRVRKNNEDAFLGLRFDAHEVHRLGKFGEASTAKHDFTFAVCDGMGGAKAGEYASQIAVDKITTLLPRAFKNSALGLDAGVADVLAELYEQIHRALVYLGSSYDECHGMQTTMSLGWFTPGWMYFGHIGDSRIYHLPAKKKEIRQLTADDTHVGWLFRNGQINEHQARTHPRRNVLQKALGGANQFVEPQVGAVAFARGDFFLLCSDGLTEGLYDHYLVDILHAAAKDEKINPAQLLVNESVKNDGRDNTTALVVQVL
ncbi:MAG: protein phosphatase 2C domain-containing protein [Verrucomicrobiae bacterium]